MVLCNSNVPNFCNQINPSLVVFTVARTKLHFTHAISLWVERKLMHKIPYFPAHKTEFFPWKM